MSNTGIPLRHIQAISGHRSLGALERYLGVTENTETKCDFYSKFLKIYNKTTVMFFIFFLIMRIAVVTEPNLIMNEWHGMIG